MALDPRYWMWAQACEMLARAERLQRRFFLPAGEQGATSQWEPPVDVFESGRRIWVTVALPGVGPEDVQVGIHDDVLVITGRRSLPEIAARARLVRLEIPHGRFQRRIALPGGRHLLVGRELRHGCLFVVLERV